MTDKEFKEKYHDSLVERNLLKKVKENIKKKRKHWLITAGYSRDIIVAYDQASHMLSDAYDLFNKEEREKYLLHKLYTAVTPVDDLCVVQICYDKK